MKEGPKERARFVASNIDKGIAYQIRALRDRQDLSQEDLAEMVDMNQNAISRLESPYRGRPTITTLKRIAEAFDVALVVRFVPFSKLIKWVSGEAFIEEGLSTDAVAVPKFDEELESGDFELPVKTISPQLVNTANTQQEVFISHAVGEIRWGNLGNYIGQSVLRNNTFTDWNFTYPKQLNFFGKEESQGQPVLTTNSNILLNPMPPPKYTTVEREGYCA